MENTITTYEKQSQAFNVLQYGFNPVIQAYRIKNYKMRKLETISNSSLRRIGHMLNKAYDHVSDNGENWFKMVFNIKLD